MVGCHDARGVDLPTSQGGQGIVDGVRAMARGKRACAVEIGDDDQSGAGAGWLAPQRGRSRPPSIHQREPDRADHAASGGVHGTGITARSRDRAGVRL